MQTQNTVKTVLRLRLKIAHILGGDERTEGIVRERHIDEVVRVHQVHLDSFLSEILRQVLCKGTRRFVLDSLVVETSNKL